MEVNVERLKELRRERVLSLRELEERSGVSYNTIWRLEDGRQGAHPRTVRKLAEALGVDPSELGGLVVRSGNGEGSIYPRKRNGKKVGYRGAYTVYTASGPKRRYVSGKTREEARQKLTKAMADRDGGLVFEAEAYGRGVPERWLRFRDGARCAEHLRDVRVHDLPAHSPGPRACQAQGPHPGPRAQLYREKLDGGLSSATVRKMHGVLQKALDQAVSDGLIPRNAAKGIRTRCDGCWLSRSRRGRSRRWARLQGGVAFRRRPAAQCEQLLEKVLHHRGRGRRNAHLQPRKVVVRAANRELENFEAPAVPHDESKISVISRESMR